MTSSTMWQEQRQEPAMAPVDEAVDHVRGSPAGRLILEYGDYECPYSRQAFRAIERAGEELAGGIRFAFRHFPLTGIHPHALAAAAAAEAAALQGRFWDMHGLPVPTARRHSKTRPAPVRRRARARHDGVRPRPAGPPCWAHPPECEAARNGRSPRHPDPVHRRRVHRGGYDPATLLVALAR